MLTGLAWGCYLSTVAVDVTPQRGAEDAVGMSAVGVGSGVEAAIASHRLAAAPALWRRWQDRHRPIPMVGFLLGRWGVPGPQVLGWAHPGVAGHWCSPWAHHFDCFVAAGCSTGGLSSTSPYEGVFRPTLVLGLLGTGVLWTSVARISSMSASIRGRWIDSSSHQFLNTHLENIH